MNCTLVSSSWAKMRDKPWKVKTDTSNLALWCVCCRFFLRQMTATRLLGRSDVATAKIYTHALRQGGRGRKRDQQSIDCTQKAGPLSPRLLTRCHSENARPRTEFSPPPHRQRPGRAADQS